MLTNWVVAYTYQLHPDCAQIPAEKQVIFIELHTFVLIMHCCILSYMPQIYKLFFRYSTVLAFFSSPPVNLASALSILGDIQSYSGKAVILNENSEYFNPCSISKIII